jgi:hypothetical protein
MAAHGHSHTWYVAAWCDEVQERPLGRKILDRMIAAEQAEAEGTPVQRVG